VSTRTDPYLILLIVSPLFVRAHEITSPGDSLKNRLLLVVSMSALREFQSGSLRRGAEGAEAREVGLLCQCIIIIGYAGVAVNQPSSRADTAFCCKRITYTYPKGLRLG
jgi:hypothetical protein